jgi:antitoxin component of MazEF toxin-antitoxin module
MANCRNERWNGITVNVGKFAVEQRQKVGLPASVLNAMGLVPGDQVQVRVTRDPHGPQLAVVPVAQVAERYAGAAPGLAEKAGLAVGLGESGRA